MVGFLSCRSTYIKEEVSDGIEWYSRASAEERDDRYAANEIRARWKLLLKPW